MKTNVRTEFKLGDRPYKVEKVYEGGIQFAKPVQTDEITKITMEKCEDGSVSVMYNDGWIGGILFKTKEEALEAAKTENGEFYGKVLRDFEELKRKGYA